MNQWGEYGDSLFSNSFSLPLSAFVNARSMGVLFPPHPADTYVLTYYYKVIIIFPNYVVDLLTTSRTSSNIT